MLWSSAIGMLASLTTHRHLLMTMVRREIGARFAGSSLGGLWSLIQPAIMLGLYTMVFSLIYRIPEVEGGHGFPEFVFCGLWPWLAFQEACTRSVSAITSNANLVKKLQFPSELLVISSVVSSFVVQGVGFLLVFLSWLVVDQMAKEELELLTLKVAVVFMSTVLMEVVLGAQLAKLMLHQVYIQYVLEMQTQQLVLLVIK